MPFRSLGQDVRECTESLSRRRFEFWSTSHARGKSHDLDNQQSGVQSSGCWATLPPELLHDVIQRVEASESSWPSRKHVVACAAVCRSWRVMCMEIVESPEFCGRLTFPVSLKQPGPRDGSIQCFIRRNKSNLTYHLFLCLSPASVVENGKFLLSAKRIWKTTNTEYIISTDADNTSRSSNTLIGKMRSNFFGTKFIMYDTQPPHAPVAPLPPPGKTSRWFSPRKVSPKVPSADYEIAHMAYELNVLGTRGPRRMQCVMDSIPASALIAGNMVPGQPELITRGLEDSFRSMSLSKSVHHSSKFSSARFSEFRRTGSEDENAESRPLVLKNKAPRWHEQLQCWCLNFRGRVTVASVKNFQLVAAGQPPQADQEKIILQFGKAGKDVFTMDYCYPLSAFQAFAICLSSFDTKLACE